MDLGLKGKSVIVTGGGSNIGRAIVLAFANEGSNITIADIDEAQGNKVVSEVESAGSRAQFVKTDVTKNNDVDNMVKKTIEQFGVVDVLINNVGWDQIMLFIETTPDLWDKIMFAVMLLEL